MHPAGDLLFDGFGFSKRSIECNVRYLRDKYNQWFSGYDEAEAEETLALIASLEDECSPVA